MFGFKGRKKSSSIELSWHLDDNLESKIKLKEYDKNYSIQQYLKKSTPVSDSEISKIMSGDNPVLAAKNLYRGGQRWDNINGYCDEAIRTGHWAILWFIDNPKDKFIFENTIVYLVLKLGQFYEWDLVKRIPRDRTFGDTFVRNLANNNDEEVIRYLDNKVLSCFAYAQKALGISVVEAIEIGFAHLELNINHTNTPLGSFCAGYGLQNAKGIIYKIFECEYRQDKFKVGQVLRKEKKTD